MFKKEKKQFKLEEIYSMLLLDWKIRAEEFLQTEVTDVVITVPADFGLAEQQSMKDAATVAGLNAMRIISESSAAAMAYYDLEEKSTTAKRNVMVCNLGETTFDVSLLEISDGKFTPKGSQTDENFGTESFVDEILEYALYEFMVERHKDGTETIDESLNIRAMNKSK